jgi:hypothetical protein
MRVSTLGMSAALIVAAAVLTGTASARVASGPCGVVSPFVIHATLGVTVGQLKVSHSHNSLTCSYSVNGVPDAVQVTWQSGVSAAEFAATTQSAARSFPHAHTGAGPGYTYWWTTVGSGPYGSTIYLLHKHTSELDITAIASYAKVSGLAHHLLRTLP